MGVRSLPLLNQSGVSVLFNHLILTKFLNKYFFKLTYFNNLFFNLIFINFNLSYNLDTYNLIEGELSFLSTFNYFRFINSSIFLCKFIIYKYSTWIVLFLYTTITKPYDDMSNLLVNYNYKAIRTNFFMFCEYNLNNEL